MRRGEKISSTLHLSHAHALTHGQHYGLLCRDRSDANVTRFIGRTVSVPARKRQCFDGVWMNSSLLFYARVFFPESRGGGELGAARFQHLDSSSRRVPRCARRGNPRLKSGGTWIGIRSSAALIEVEGGKEKKGEGFALGIGHLMRMTLEELIVILPRDDASVTVWALH